MLVKIYNRLIQKTFINHHSSTPKNSGLISELRGLSNNLNPEDPLPSDIVMNIENIFIKRAQEVAKGQYIYTSTIKEALDLNTPWIFLARKLCGSGYNLFKCHYYKLLFPQAKNLESYDFIQYGPLIKQGLRDLFFSTKTQMLLSLKSGLQCAVANRGVMGFYICNDVEEENKEKLSKSYWYVLDDDAEIDLLSKTNPRYFKKLSKLKEEKDNNDSDKQLSYITVLALSLMIECSFFKSGVNGKYNKDQKQTAKNAYQSFVFFLSLITEEERCNLMGQIIWNEGSGVLFEHLWKAVTSRAVCVTWANKDIISLILDYQSDHQFNNPSLIGYNTSSREKECSSKSPFESRYQILAMAFTIIDSLYSDMFYSTKLTKLINEQLLPLSTQVDNGTESSHTIDQECIAAVKKAMNIFTSILQHVNQLICTESSFDYMREKQSGLLLKFSELTIEKSKQIICGKLIYHHHFQLEPEINFFEKLRTLSNVDYFTSITHQVAVGFVVINKLKESCESVSHLNTSTISLFSKLNKGEVDEVSVQHSVSELINLFIISKCSLEDKKMLSNKISQQLVDSSSKETIVHTAIDQMIQSLCSPPSYVIEFSSAPLKDSKDNIVNVVSLKEEYIQQSLASPPDNYKNILQDILTFLISNETYTFLPSKIEAAQSLVSDSYELDSVSTGHSDVLDL